MIDVLKRREWMEGIILYLSNLQDQLDSMTYCLRRSKAQSETGDFRASAPLLRSSNSVMTKLRRRCSARRGFREKQWGTTSRFSVVVRNTF
jgi:hypothetical protein